jgi:hypothetical protein
MGEHADGVIFKNDALERIGWSAVEGACTGALTAWGVTVFTTADGFQTFLVAVGVPAGVALFTALKTLAAKHLGDPASAAIG